MQKQTPTKFKKKFILPWKRKGAKALPHGIGTRVNILVKEYYMSQRYQGLSIQTKRMYISILRAMENLILANGHSILDMQAHNVDYGIADYVKRLLLFSLKPQTVGIYFSVLSNIWDLAIRNGRAIINPWKKPNLVVKNLREITWSPEQIRIAVEASKELNFNLLSIYIELAYATAQRPWSDLRNLKWSNLKLDREGNYVLDFVLQKTNTHVVLPLSSQTSYILGSIPRKSEYIFADEDGARLHQQTLTVQFKKVKKYAMLDNSLMIRDLRRTAVTEMAMSGATSQEITAITGWRVSERVINRYAVMKLATAKNALTKREEYMRKDAEQQLQQSNAIHTETAS